MSLTKNDDALEKEPLLAAEEGKDADKEKTNSVNAGKKDPRPSWASFLACSSYSVLTVTSFTIVIPTSAQYSESLNVGAELAGVLVGIVPFVVALAQYPVSEALGRFSLRSVLLTGVLINIIGNILYALGDLSGSFATVIVGRVISGLMGGPAYLTTFVARTTGKTTRTEYMLLVSSFIGFGYTLGPFLGLLTELVANAAKWDGEVVNSNTLPGWLMVILFFLDAIVIMFLFEEPKTSAKVKPPSASVNGKDKTAAKDVPTPKDSLPWFSIFWYYLQIFLVPFNVAGWELIIVTFGTIRWGLSIEIISVILACINFIPFFLGVLKANLQRCIKNDCDGILVSFTLSFIASILFFYYPISVDAAISLFCLGGFITLYGMQNAKGFLFSTNSKWTNKPLRRKKVMMFNNMFYMAGRGVGAFIPPFLTFKSDFAIYILCLNIVGILLSVFSRRLHPSSKA